MRSRLKLCRGAFGAVLKAGGTTAAGSGNAAAAGAAGGIGAIRGADDSTGDPFDDEDEGGGSAGTLVAGLHNSSAFLYHSCSITSRALSCRSAIFSLT